MAFQHQKAHSKTIPALDSDNIPCKNNDLLGSDPVMTALCRPTIAGQPLSAGIFAIYFWVSQEWSFQAALFSKPVSKRTLVIPVHHQA
jgi:hypothetical protein